MFIESVDTSLLVAAAVVVTDILDVVVVCEMSSGRVQSEAGSWKPGRHTNCPLFPHM